MGKKLSFKRCTRKQILGEAGLRADLEQANKLISEAAGKITETRASGARFGPVGTSAAILGQIKAIQSSAEKLLKAFEPFSVDAICSVAAQEDADPLVRSAVVREVYAAAEQKSWRCKPLVLEALTNVRLAGWFIRDLVNEGKVFHSELKDLVFDGLVQLPPSKRRAVFKAALRARLPHAFKWYWRHQKQNDDTGQYYEDGKSEKFLTGLVDYLVEAGADVDDVQLRTFMQVVKVGHKLQVFGYSKVDLDTILNAAGQRANGLLTELLAMEKMWRSTELLKQRVAQFGEVKTAESLLVAVKKSSSWNYSGEIDVLVALANREDLAGSIKTCESLILEKLGSIYETWKWEPLRRLRLACLQFSPDFVAQLLSQSLQYDSSKESFLEALHIVAALYGQRADLFREALRDVVNTLAWPMRSVLVLATFVDLLDDNLKLETVEYVVKMLKQKKWKDFRKLYACVNLLVALSPDSIDALTLPEMKVDVVRVAKHLRGDPGHKAWVEVMENLIEYFGTSPLLFLLRPTVEIVFTTFAGTGKFLTDRLEMVELLGETEDMDARAHSLFVELALVGTSKR